MSTRSRAAIRPAIAAPIFAALGDETRLVLVTRLCTGGPRSIRELSKGSAVSRQAVTKHLNVLAAAGLLRGVRRGREHIWEITPHRLDEARRCLDLIAERWDQALDRLKRFVEE